MLCGLRVIAWGKALDSLLLDALNFELSTLAGLAGFIAESSDGRSARLPFSVYLAISARLHFDILVFHESDDCILESAGDKNKIQIRQCNAGNRVFHESSKF